MALQAGSIDRVVRFGAAFALVLAAGAIAGACSVPNYDSATYEGKQAIIDATNVALSSQNCSTAISDIEGLYSSAYTDNQVRLLRASAHGCNAGVNFFKNVGDLASNKMTPPDFWQTAAKLFPSTTTDSKVESGWYATDALMAAVKPGSVISAADQINATTTNPGSLLATDRVDDSNLYMIFISLSVIGGLESRWGAPDPNNGYKKTKALPWTTPAAVDENGCSYVAGILNLIDALGAFQGGSSNLSSTRDAVKSLETNIVNVGCDAGCADPTCGFAIGDCNPCPINMRDRNGCDFNGTVDQKKAACAAAGLVKAINTDTSFGWLGP